MTEPLTEAEIRYILTGKFEGTRPFGGRKQEYWEYQTKQIKSALGEIRSVEVFTHSDSYGSGFASYEHHFLSLPNGRGSSDKGEYFEVTGIELYISRLAPLAAFGAGKNSRNKKNGGSYGFLEASTIDCLPNHEWEEPIKAVKSAIEAFGYRFMLRAEASTSLWFDASIPTIMNGNDIFTAVFFWED